MKKTIVIATALAALLGGCGMFHGGKSSNYATMPQVVITDKPDASGNPSFFVSPNTLVFKPEQRNVEIVWRLPKDAKLRFSPRLGIVINGEIRERVTRLPRDGSDKAAMQSGVSTTYIDPDQNEIVDCKVRDDGLAFSCLNKHSRPGRYKYSVRLTDGASDYLIDPEIDNW